jgi:phosphopentomutase
MLIHESDDKGLMTAARSDLVHGGREFTFVHFGHVDLTGHATGFMSPAYLAAVQKVDGLVGKLIRAIESHPDLAGTVVILTADHGGKGRSHYDPTKYVNYRIPFVVWGPGVTHGDLYAMNTSYADPGTARVLYSGRQPVRNGDLANLSLDLLGLGAVPDSKYDVQQSLTVSSAPTP